MGVTCLIQWTKFEKFRAYLAAYGFEVAWKGRDTIRPFTLVQIIIIWVI